MQIPRSRPERRRRDGLRNALVAAGLHGRVGRYQYSQTVPKGNVIYTYPRGRATTPPRARQVQLIVSQGPEALVPPVTDRQLSKTERYRRRRRSHLLGLLSRTTPPTSPATWSARTRAPGAGNPGSVVSLTVEQVPTTTTTTTTTTSTTTTTTIPGGQARRRGRPARQAGYPGSAKEPPAAQAATSWAASSRKFPSRS